MKGINWNTTS